MNWYWRRMLKKLFKSSIVKDSNFLFTVHYKDADTYYLIVYQMYDNVLWNTGIYIEGTLKKLYNEIVDILDDSTRVP